MVCTVKQLFSLWPDPLLMEYLKSTKFRVLSDCSYCAEPASHKPALHTGLLCQGYQKCVPHSWTRTHNILEQFRVAQNLRPPDAEKNPNLDGTWSLQTAGHTIFYEVSQEIKSRHFPQTQGWLSQEINAQLLKSLGFTVSQWRLSSVGFFCLLSY